MGAPPIIVTSGRTARRTLQPAMLQGRAGALVALIAALVLTAFATSAAAKKAKKKPPPDRGSIVYGQGKHLWRVSASGGKAIKVAKLGFAAKRLTVIRASDDGTMLLVSTDENHYWLNLVGAGEDLPVVRHVCRGVASMSGDGSLVLCEDKDGVVNIEKTGDAIEKTPLAIRGKLATLAGNVPDEVVIVTDRGIEAIKLADIKKRRSLGTVAPLSNLLVAPDGKRAVAVFSDAGGGTGLYSFLFDGKGVRRKLVTEAVPIAWSADSKWLVVTRKKRGCVVRAAGGQYRCFDGYRAHGVSPDLKDALLTSGSPGSLTVFRADLGGARSSKPVPMVKKAQGAAIWLAP
jgi:hypothetical protein